MILPSTRTGSFESVPGNVFTIVFTCEPTTNLGPITVKSAVFSAALVLARSLASFFSLYC